MVWILKDGPKSPGDSCVTHGHVSIAQHFGTYLGDWARVAHRGPPSRTGVEPEIELIARNIQQIQLYRYKKEASVVRFKREYVVIKNGAFWGAE